MNAFTGKLAAVLALTTLFLAGCGGGSSGGSGGDAPSGPSGGGDLDDEIPF